MRFKTFVISLLTAALLCLGGAFALAAGAETAIGAGDVTPEMKVKMASVQVPFVPNEGQVGDARVKFYAKTFAGTVFVTNNGVNYTLPKNEDGGWVVQEELAGGKTLAPAPVGAPAAPVNYFIGNDSGKWRQNLPSYDEITLGEIYDHVNVNLRAYGDNVEKIFTVGPGGDPAAIALKVTGADKLSVNERGELELATGLGTVKMTRPAAYQVIDGRRVDVDVAYAVKGDSYGFTVGGYNHAYPLVIDPLLSATLLGGGGNDFAQAVAYDTSGNYVFVAGRTSSSSSTSDFPQVAGGYQTSNGGGSYDVFVAKFDSGLTQLLVATYLGGGASDQADALAVDASGNVYVTGSTKSSNFPVNGYSQTYNSSGKYDAFVAKLNNNLNQPPSARYIGGSDDDRAYAIGLDSQDNVYVAGYTLSTDFVPSGVPGYKTTKVGSQDAFVVKLSANLDTLAAATYIGGGSTDTLRAMAVKADGTVYIAGDTSNNVAPAYPTTPVAYQTSAKSSGTVGFVTEFSDITQAPVASTFLGASNGADSVRAITLDSQGKVYVTGSTTGTDFPTTTGASNNGNNDIFVTKLNGNLTAEANGKPLASTLVGGAQDDNPYAIAPGSGGNVYIGGQTYSGTGFPTTAGSYTGSGVPQAFVAKLNSDFSGLTASTLLGGSGSSNTVNALALDAAGHVYAAGSTNSSDLGIATGLHGTYDAFVAKFTSDLATPAPVDNTPPTWTGGSLAYSNVFLTGLTLDWSGVTYNDDVGVTGYQILLIDGSVIDSVYNGSAASYNVAGLAAGTTYTFKVKAFDAAGNLSTDGPSVTATITSDTPTWPSASSLTATNVAATSLTLTWPAAQDNVAVTAYRVYKGGGLIDTVSSAVYTTVSGAVYYNYSVTGLAPNNTYIFKVEAGDASNNWSADGPSLTAATVAPDTSTPVWPPDAKIVFSTLNSTSVKLSWTTQPATDNVAVVGYQVLRATTFKSDGSWDYSVIDTVYAPTTEYTATGLTDSQYYFKILAYDAAGNVSSTGPEGYAGSRANYLDGAYLASISGSPPSTAPGAGASTSIDGSSSVPLNPMFECAFSSNFTVDTHWSNNQQCFTLQTANGDNVPISVLRIPDLVNFEERQHIFVKPQAMLAPATHYKLTISQNLTANNGGGLPVSPEVNFTTTASASGAPAWAPDSSLTAPFIGDTFLTLHWPAATGSAGIAGYVVLRNGEIVAAADGATLGVTVTGLNLSTAYNFQVLAFDTAGNWSATGPGVSVTTAATKPPGIPSWTTGQAATVSYTAATHDRLTLSWPAASDNAGITNYRISEKDALGNWSELATVGANTLSYNVTGLTEATTHIYKIEALNLAGTWTPVPLAANVYTGGGTWYGGDNSTAPFEFLNAFLTTATPGSASSDTGDSMIGSGSVPAMATFKLNFSKNAIANWSSNQVFITMLDSSGNNVPITKFIINNDAEKNNVFVAPVSPLSPLVTYKIMIDANFKAKNGSILGNKVAISFTTSAPLTWPADATLDASNVTQTGLTLTWTAAQDSAGTPNYRILENGNVIATVNGPATTYNVTGLSAGSAYDFHVQAFDAAGNWNTNGPATAAVTFTSDTTASIPVTFSDNDPDPDVDVEAYLNTSGSVTTGTLPGLNITKNTTLNSNTVQLQVTIPAGVTVTANASDHWDGKIHTTVQANSSVTLSNATVNAVIEYGNSNVVLNFNQPVRILIPGQATLSVGYVRGGMFYPITTVLTATDTAAAAAQLTAANAQEGRMNAGNDLVIWTRHFTKFVTYTPSNNSPGVGVLSDIQAPTWPAGAKATGTKDTSSVTLKWTPATDNVGVTKYMIYQDSAAGTLLYTLDASTLTAGSDGNITYTFNVDQGIGSHAYAVQALDAAGNASAVLTSDIVGGSNPVDYQGAYLTTAKQGDASSDQKESVGGSVSVPVRPTIKLVFGRNVCNDSIWANNQQCVTLQDSSGSNVPINVFRLSGDPDSEEKHNIFITPLSDLAPGETYKIIISPNLKANNGRTLGEDTNGQNKVITFTVAGTKIITKGPDITTGAGSVDPAVGATVGQGDQAKVVIPANALKETSPVTVSVQKVNSPPAAPADVKPASDVYEFTVGNNTTYTFNSNVAVTLSFNASVIGADQVPAIFYYDETQKRWVNLGGTVSGNTITVQVDHFTKFAVLAVKETAIPVVTPMPGTVTDIAGHWAEANIRKLVDLKVISGYEDGTFKPDNTITRAEFATLLVKAFKLEIRNGEVFADTAGHWAKDYISTAAVFGIVNGYEDGNFGPDDLITREQMAMMIVKAAKLAAINEETKFEDRANISDWASSAVTTAVKNGIIKGYPDNIFQPQGNATRAEAVTVIMNALKLPS